MNDYILFSDVPCGAEFIEIDREETVIVKRHTRYDLVRKEDSGSDMGIVLYNGQTPLGYRSHNTDASIGFWEVGSLSTRVRRAFFTLAPGTRVLARKQRNDLKIGAS